VLKCSAQIPNGIIEVWTAVKNYHDTRLLAVEIKEQRDQAKELEQKILDGKILSPSAANILFNNGASGTLTDGKLT
jgi:hypothetical protein